MEIHYLDDDEPTAPRQSRRPRIPPQTPPPPSHRPPVPGGSDQSWWACNTETCNHYGYVATGPDPEDLVEEVKWGRCRECHGLGIAVDEDGAECEHCEGKGRKKIRSQEVPPTTQCPYCRYDMVFMAYGQQPNGYPRMGTPDIGEGDFEGSASQFGAKMGRTRRVE